MRRFIHLSEKHLFYRLLYLGAGVCVCFSLLSFPANGGTSEGNEPVSLTVQDMPLAAVLEELSKATGYKFSVNEEWLDFPISVSFESIPLHSALKRMFADLNSAVIYGSDKKIKIIIYNDASEAQATPEKPKAKSSTKKGKSKKRAAQQAQPSSSDSQRREDGEESNSIQNALDEYRQSEETSEVSSSESQAEESSDGEASEDTAESESSGEGETQNSDRAASGQTN